MNVNPNRKTFTQKPADVQRKWVVIDASVAPLGRLSTVIATRLIGKYQPTFTPHVDAGDHVIVINAANTQVTGTKLKDKTYYKYSGFPGGMKSASLAEKMEKDPTHAIRAAVKGMLPKNKLASDRLARLKVYSGSEHQHQAQKPETIGVNN